MIKKLLGCGLVACLLLSCFPLIVCAEASWLDGYSRRELFYWQGSGAGQDSFIVYNQTGINQNSKFYIFNETQLDFDDLALTLADGTTELSLWNQTTFNQANCTVWANFPTANVSYYLYWNNIEAVAKWNQSAVFNAVIVNNVASWPFDEGSGTIAYDYSGNSNNGIISNAEYTEGKFGYALNFTSGDFVNCGSNASLILSSNLTYAGWFKTSSVADYPAIFSRYYGGAATGIYSLLGFLAGGRVRGIVANGSAFQAINSIAEYDDGVWHFAVFVLDNSFLRLYIDGAAESPVARTLNPASDASEVRYVGRYSTNYFIGLLDNLQIFGSALSVNEVLALSEGFGDASLEVGKVLVRSWITGNSVNLFGVVESAPIVEPTVDPGALTGEDAVGVAVALCVVFFGAGVGLIFVVKKRND